MSSQASFDLTWQIVGRNNKYYQKRGTIRFSNDPFNNTGKATKRHAGFLQTKAAAVRVKKEKDVYVAVKDGSNVNKPAKQWVKNVTGVKASDASKAVAAVRPDLADIAFRRAAKLTKTAKNVAARRAARKTALAAKTYKRTNKRVKKAKKN
jgi:large subunit ribosomal protein L28e